MPVCLAEKEALTTPIIHELEYYCLTFRHKDCPIFRKQYRGGEPMRYTGVERRKHQRFKASIPVNIGLIDFREEKTTGAQFRGVTTDISMEGLGLELKYPEAGMFPFRTRVMGEEREFDLEINAKVGGDMVSGIGEVRWFSTPSPSVIRMGVFLKEIIEGETEKWRDLVMSQNRQTRGNRKRLGKRG